jgi:hypothetical protein
MEIDIEMGGTKTDQDIPMDCCSYGWLEIPILQWVKLNVDGNSKGNSGITGSEVYCRTILAHGFVVLLSIQVVVPLFEQNCLQP